MLSGWETRESHNDTIPSDIYSVRFHMKNRFRCLGSSSGSSTAKAGSIEARYGNEQLRRMDRSWKSNDSFRLTQNFEDGDQLWFQRKILSLSVQGNFGCQFEAKKFFEAEFASIYIAVYNDRFLAPLFSSHHTTRSSNTQCAPKKSQWYWPSFCTYRAHIVIRCLSWSLPRYIHSTRFLRTEKFELPM